MKHCPTCGIPKADEEFAEAKGKADGLAWECLECNRKRGEQWTADNLQHKRAYQREYARRRRAGEILVGELGQRRKITRERIKRQIQEEETTEYHLIRFTEPEWMFCLLQGQALGLKPEDYVRFLVKDARRKEEN